MKNRLLPSLASAAATVLLALAGTVQAYTIAFDNLPGPDGSQYLSSTEGGFAIIASSGTWFQDTDFGNPAPSIFAFGLNTSAIEITGGTFTFHSFQYFNAEDPGSYSVEGFLGGNSQYNFGGTLTGTGWNTLLSQNSIAVVDLLRIAVTPSGPAGPSISLDNIVVNAATSVPDSGGSLLLLGLGLAGLIGWRVLSFRPALA